MPYVREDVDAVDAAPDQTAEEKRGDEDDAVNQLVNGAGQLELVHEPVHVQGRRGELVEDKDWAVVVEEGTLCGSIISYALLLLLYTICSISLHLRSRERRQ